MGSAAAKVRVGFDDQTFVTATLAAGWWAMWWPGTVVPPQVNALDRRDLAIGSVVPSLPPAP